MDAEYDPIFEYERLLAQAYLALSQKHVYLMQTHSTNPNGYIAVATEANLAIYELAVTLHTLIA